MNKLSTTRRAKIVQCLIEGNSVRATCRLTGSDKGAVLRLLKNLGEACLDFMQRVMVNLPCRQIQVDEVWSFTYAKAKNVPERLKGEAGYGDTWNYIALDPVTKLVPVFRVGERNAETAKELLNDLASRLAHRVQLTTDGHKMYLSAVEEAFGDDIDYAMLNKVYGGDADGEKRYSPAKFITAKKEKINGSPATAHISTSHVERLNLTVRMQNRRFTRLTNGFSKKIENHKHSLAIQFAWYNFARIHQTLRVTPAMEAGLANHVWEIEELIGLLDGRDWVGRK